MKNVTESNISESLKSCLFFRNEALSLGLYVCSNREGVSRVSTKYLDDLSTCIALVKL